MPKAVMMTLAVALVCFAGCSSKPTLMPTPNLYTWGSFDPFDKVPQELQNNRVQVLYVTDRLQKEESKDQVTYGYLRSRSTAFGTSDLVIGENLSWDELKKASRTKRREQKLELTVTNTKELGRFAATPRRVFELVSPSATTRRVVVEDPMEVANHTAAEEAFQKELSAKLAIHSHKEVYLFVHGFANDFNDAIITIGELWHFFGRRGVPMAYTWPAGSPGILSYMYDRESSEFTVYHLKQTLRLIAANPDVQKINIISHSRGTDVAASAIRELYLEYKHSEQTVHQRLKLGSVILAAPDLDIDVVLQRMATERIGQLATDRSAIYVCSSDKALGLSNWLFSGAMRLGRIESKMFNPAEVELMRSSPKAQIIDAHVGDAGAFGHDYFHSNPAVSSDLILLMRYHLDPGTENGRPLRVKEHGFWMIDDDYPGPAKTFAAHANEK